MQRVFTTSQCFYFTLGTKKMCALVQSYKQRPRVWQFHGSLDPVETELPKLFVCTHWRFESMRLSLNLEQFVAEGTDNVSPCEEHSHSQGKPCSNLDKAQSPIDQRKKDFSEKTVWNRVRCEQRIFFDPGPMFDEDRTPRRTHIFLSVVHAAACGSSLTAHVWDVLHLCAPQKSSTHSMDHSLTCLTHFHHLFHATSFYIDSTAYDWNQETSQRHSARRITVWPSG